MTNVATAIIKERTDLLDLIGRDTTLRKVASTRGGEFAGPCPFCGGCDRLRVQPAFGTWWCRGCSDRWEDAIAYVRKRDDLSFDAACDVLGAEPPARRGGRPPASAPVVAPTPIPTPQWRANVRRALERCEQTLWSDEGVRARDWLGRRGLTEETLRAWRVGYQPQDGEISGLFVRRGIVVPWIVDGDLWQLKVRRPDPLRPKYMSVAGGHPLLFGADTLTGRRVAVLTEGEFDAMLIHQEVGDLVGVATLGSCSKRLDARAISYLLPVERVLVAYDRDADGENGAGKLLALSQRMRRVRPPFGKEASEFWVGGGSVRDWLHFELARLDGPVHPLHGVPRHSAPVPSAGGASRVSLTERMRGLGFVPSTDGPGWVLTPERAASCVAHADRPLAPGDKLFCEPCRVDVRLAVETRRN
ncbi:MAG: CHC2 zinc finger domain-containing protein [Chloroflexota bacterium]|nr:CHC2 zinc finger domain-containing protein [Chloroflexota bacterium]